MPAHNLRTRHEEESPGKVVVYKQEESSSKGGITEKD